MSVDLKQLQSDTFQLCDSAFFQQVVMDHCNLPANASFAVRPDLCIHARDQMLLHSLFHHRDPNIGFSQYYNVALQQFYSADQIIRLMFPEANRSGLEIMDFACGYGRLLRFLTATYPDSTITASEIQMDALEFVKETYQITTIPSCPDPDDFNPEKPFQFIWVASLFSHLPTGLFQRWLAKLHSCLAPEGVLCFSVHDACLLPEGHDFPEDEGIYFWPGSENQDLAATIYGTTYVNERFVAEAIHSAIGARHPYYRLPRALAHEQDIYVVASRPDTDLSILSNFRRGAWGWADERYVSESGELYLRGWAASVDDGRLDFVDIRIDDEHFRIPTGTGISREDVGLFFNDSRMNTSGWEFRHQLTPGDSPVKVVASASTSKFEKALLFAGQFERPVPHTVPDPLLTADHHSRGWWSKIRKWFVAR